MVVGAGAGLSAAAGLRYDGPEFFREFADFVEKYGISDLYSSSFYPFETEEEYWACWARHIDFARYRPGAAPLYGQLLGLLRGKDYFVVTTNVDGQFRKTGFDAQRLFEVQGDYAFLQCSKGCHDTLYYNERLVKEMVAQTRDCQIPSHLVPRCPRCGEPMAVHVRVDEHFVQNAQWEEAYQRYADFLSGIGPKERVVLLELGVGFNTPSIIRLPFEQMAQERRNVTLIRVNKENVACLLNVKNCLLIRGEIAELFAENGDAPAAECASPVAENVSTAVKSGRNVAV